MFDYRQIKEMGKRSLAGVRPGAYSVTCCYVLLTWLVSYICMPADSALETTASAGVTSLLLLVGLMVSWVLTYGFRFYGLQLAKAQAKGYGDLLAGFSDAWRAVKLYFIMGFFTMLWSLLFLIPGLVASYRYRFAPYLMMENPTMGAMEAISRSKAMTMGHKMSLFYLDVSIMIWYLVATVIYFNLSMAISGPVALMLEIPVLALEIVLRPWDEAAVAHYYLQRSLEPSL